MAMLIAQYLLALRLGGARGTVDEELAHSVSHGLHQMPAAIEEVLKRESEAVTAANAIDGADDVYFIGRGLDYAIAMEGSLKLKEISYVHAEGYPAAEMKHGPIALIDENMPVVIICPRDAAYQKIIGNINEVKARKGKIIAITTEGDDEIIKMADHVIFIPRTLDFLYPILAVIPLQLMAYHIAVMRGCHVDQPRNLAKSVTVE